MTTPTPVVVEQETEPGLSDAELLRAHVAGDPDAFATLIERHRHRLWGLALRTMRDPEDAADALQDALIAAFRRADSFRGEAQVLTWLHRIVLNACLDKIRRNAVRRAEPLPEDLDRDLTLVAADDPLASTEQREVHDIVAAALARLNADQRAALVLVDMQGYSVEDAATMLGCATGTIKSRCSRGRARLAPMLADLRVERG